MFKRIYFLIIKEFLAVWHDKKSRMMLIVPPILQLCLFSFAATLDVKNVSIAILNKDNGKYAFELIQRFKGSPTFVNIVYLDHVKEIQKVVDNQDVILAIHIDEQFSRNLLLGKSAQVQMILDGRKSNSAQIVQGYAIQILERFNEDIAKELKLPQSPEVLIVRNWFNPNLIYNWFTIAGLVAILTMVTGLAVTAQSVARERELGTFDQLLVSPLVPFEILVGKMVPGIIIGMSQGTMIFCAAVFLFGVPMEGAVWVLYLSMFVFICSIVGIGLFISSLSMTQQQAVLGVFVFMSPAVSLSGFATPIENMPEWLQPWTMANPLRHFLVVTRGVMMRGMSAEDVLHHTLPLAVIAFCTLSAATFLFRRRLG